MQKKLNMFVCGPTVYDYIHIGNARTFVIFDAYAKWLRSQGIQVRYIQNITDIEECVGSAVIHCCRLSKHTRGHRQNQYAVENPIHYAYE